MALQTLVPPVEKLGTESTERSNSVHGFNWQIISEPFILTLCRRGCISSGSLGLHSNGRGTPQARCDSSAIPILDVLIALVASFFIRRVAGSFHGHLSLLARIDTDEDHRPGVTLSRRPHLHLVTVDLGRRLLTAGDFDIADRARLRRPVQGRLNTSVVHQKAAPAKPSQSKTQQSPLPP